MTIMQTKDKANNDPWVPLSADGDDETSHPNTAVTSYKPGNSNCCSFDQEDFFMPAPIDPLRQTIDSEKYIQSLERKLEKLQKARQKKGEPTSKDIITSLALFHDDQMRRFIDNTAPSESQFVSNHDEAVPTVSALQRRLHPERQPLNAEEIIELVGDDVVGKAFEELNITEVSSSTTVQQNILHTKSDTFSNKCDNKSDILPQICKDLSLKTNKEETPTCSTNLPSNTNSSDSSHNGGKVEENWANFDEFEDN